MQNPYILYNVNTYSDINMLKQITSLQANPLNRTRKIKNKTQYHFHQLDSCSHKWKVCVNAVSPATRRGFGARGALRGCCHR